MQFPESWLREFCDPPIGTAELAEKLTMAGLEVESVRPAAPPFRGVVVGEVLEVERHPDADKLRVCRVDVGSSPQLSIVCGAPNVRAGIKVPCALVGAELPPAEGKGTTPFRIELGKIRGVASEGMLCSARELGLSEDHAGLLVLDADARIGADLREALALDDAIFTLKLTPNLGHALSVYGVAREVAALTGAPLHSPSIAPVAASDDSTLRVAVEAPDLCGRFAGRIVRGVDPKAKTPPWMVERLARCGQRSVSALVDISNYLMFELGRPTHVFDLDRIEGGLHVRWGRAGETLELLNGQTVELDASVGVIADDVRVESLAGIMGGAATAVSDATTQVYVEAAFWWPEAVAGRSRRFNFATDAGHRFERGVDATTIREHLERITGLIVSICGGAATRVGPIDEQIVALPERDPIRLRVDRASRVIGMPVTQADCESVFTRLGFAWSSAAPGTIDVVAPSWRFDLRLEEDLIEEIVRLLGYDTLPPGPAIGAMTARVEAEAVSGPSSLRHSLADLGWQETISFGFVDEAWERDFAGNADPVRVVNPIASNASVMRSTLIGSLVEVLRVNQARRVARGRVFELGKVYLRDGTAADGPHAVAGVRQPLRLSGLAWGSAMPLQWATAERGVDFFDVKGELSLLLAPRRIECVAIAHPALHPGRAAAIEIDGQRIGVVGELHPRWRQAYELPAHVVVFELDVAALAARRLPAHEPLPRQQPVWRDLAIVVDRSVSHRSLIETIVGAGLGVVRAATLFDVYEPKAPAADIAAAEHGLAVRLELRDDATTLTEPRIDAAVASVVDALAAKLGARLRR